MGNLVIKNRDPNTELYFLIKGTILEYSAKSAPIKTLLPRACPLMSKVNIKYKVTVDNSQSGADNAQFGFYKFQKRGTSGNKYKMRLYFSDKKTKSEFVKNNYMKIQAPVGSPLRPLNNQQGLILDKKTAGDRIGCYVDFFISTSYQPTTNSGTVSSSTHYLIREKKKKTIKKYTVSIPDAEVFQQLVNMKQSINDPNGWVVRDIPIYSYINYQDSITSDDKMKLLRNDAEVNNKTPPAYSSQLNNDYFVKSFYKNFEVTDKQNYAFYVAIARYVRVNGTWTGTWLQTNSSNKAIWSKAAKA